MLEDFEACARKQLPRPLFGYASGATETNATPAQNRRSFDDWRWLPRAMVNVARRCLKLSSSSLIAIGEVAATWFRRRFPMQDRRVHGAIAGMAMAMRACLRG
ncbi:alpha-hydroxy-acid oxidizing protein [Pseudomonas matsuisoli]|uniref:alpha-hydroxy-acid oxidizing protein n=1 Tax=Pseudomonas matsuisoli TaxID=1515666 RepID=UPI0016674660